jgi:hypothetical protein
MNTWVKLWGSKAVLVASLAILNAVLIGCDAEPAALEPDASTDLEDDAGPIADASPDSDPDASPTADAGPEGYQLVINVQGDLTPKVFDDGLSGQTPTNYFMGVQRLDIEKAGDEADPWVTVFDHGADYVEVDMHASQTAGTASFADLPPGSYSRCRVLLAMARFDVEATVHVDVPPVALHGPLTVVTALSDTVIDGQTRAQSWAEFTFDLGGYTTSREGSIPELPSAPGAEVVQEGGRTWLVFPLESPIVIPASVTRDYEMTITYDIFESFRWADQALPGYVEGIFDVNASTGAWEPVMSFGATDYHITPP